MHYKKIFPRSLVILLSTNKLLIWGGRLHWGFLIWFHTLITLKYTWEWIIPPFQSLFKKSCSKNFEGSFYVADFNLSDNDHSRLETLICRIYSPFAEREALSFLLLQCLKMTSAVTWRIFVNDLKVCQDNFSLAFFKVLPVPMIFHCLVLQVELAVAILHQITYHIVVI